MLRRTTKIQLIAFLVITLLGIAYVGAEYVGLAKNLLASPCSISADFANSGGIFTNAEVTYRGVTVGRVAGLQLIPNGVRVDLDLDNCASTKIPQSSSAVVADRSVIGEQYVNLVPPNNKPPYVHSGYVISMKRTSLPVAPETLLVNLNRFFTSVPLGALRTTITELDNAFNGHGQDLGRLLDYNNEILNTALKPNNVNDTVNLIKSSAIVLQTQLDEQQPLASWTHSLNLLSQQFVKSDADIRHLFNTGPSDLGTVTKFIQNNRTDLGVVFANLDTFGRLLVRYQGGIEEVFELYPALAAGGPTTLHNHIGALGLVLQKKPVPQDCGDPHHDRQGYNGVRRGPEALYPIAPDIATRCTAPLSTGTNVRGSAHVPGGDPISTQDAGIAYPDVVTANMRAGASGGALQVGEPTTPNNGSAGSSWLSLLSAGIR